MGNCLGCLHHPGARPSAPAAGKVLSSAQLGGSDKRALTQALQRQMAQGEADAAAATMLLSARCVRALCMSIGGDDEIRPP